MLKIDLVSILHNVLVDNIIYEFSVKKEPDPLLDPPLGQIVGARFMKQLLIFFEKLLSNFLRS